MSTISVIYYQHQHSFIRAVTNAQQQIANNILKLLIILKLLKIKNTLKILKRWRRSMPSKLKRQDKIEELAWLHQQNLQKNYLNQKETVKQKQKIFTKTIIAFM